MRSASVILFALASLSSPATASRQSHGASSSYAAHLLVHRRHFDDAVSYSDRLALFEKRKAEVEAHNAQKHSWHKALNQFSDYTDEELRATMGYKRVGGRWSSFSSSLVQTEEQPHGVVVADYDDEVDSSQFAAAVDWRQKMNVSNEVHDQGACGSCWAHAAVAALEAHAELAGVSSSLLATQEVVDCTANPQKCGGSGGCHGATAEIAFEHVRKYGIAMKDAYSTSKTSCGVERTSRTAALHISGFVRLPENRGSHLLRALATKGPVVLSVAANSLHSYGGGVFSGCQPDSIVNHAVLGTGYGTDKRSGKMFWNIKNSWTTSWGEKGYFRVERHSDDNDYCGTDMKPEDGVYCEKHPDSIRVCGMCGITSDSAYPIVSAPVASKSNLRSTQMHKDLFNVF